MNWKQPKISSWPWLNDGVLLLALILLRVCWLWLWLELAQGLLIPAYPDPLLPAWLIAGLLLTSLVATRWLLRWTSSLAHARLGIAALGLLVMFLVFWWQFYRLDYPWWNGRWLLLWGRDMLFWRQEPSLSYFVLPVVTYLWLRGIVDGSRPLDRSHVVNAFGAGCLALAAFLLVATASGWSRPVGTGNIVILFFAMAMVALTLSSLKIVPTYEAGQAGVVRFNRYWLGSVLVIIAGLLALGLLFSLLIAPESIGYLVELAWGVISQLLIWLIQLISLLLYPILYLLVRLLAWLFPADGSGLPALPSSEVDPIGPPGRLASAIENMPDEWRWVSLLFFILGIGLLFALVLRRLLVPGKDGIEETREVIFSRDLLLAQLAQLRPAWLSQLRQRSAALVSPFLSLMDEPDSRRIIRAAYQALLATAQARKLARGRAQTPLEYEGTLAQALPEEQEVLDVITKRYVQARYDAEPPTSDAAEQTQRAWQRLQRALQARHDGE